MTVSARQASEDEARAQSDGSALDLPTTITGASVVLWACGEIGAWAATGFGNPNGAVLWRTLAAVAGPVVWVSVGGVAIVAVLTRRRVRPRGRVGAGGGVNDAKEGGWEMNRRVLIGWRTGCGRTGDRGRGGGGRAGPVTQPAWRLFAAAVVFLCGGLGVAAALILEQEQPGSRQE